MTIGVIIVRNFMDGIFVSARTKKKKKFIVNTYKEETNTYRLVLDIRILFLSCFTICWSEIEAETYKTVKLFFVWCMNLHWNKCLGDRWWVCAWNVRSVPYNRKQTCHIYSFICLRFRSLLIFVLKCGTVTAACSLKNTAVSWW